eukprot:comp18906_c1_seq1/m.21049 comp18906_c1_seq1/g.21049  ORF comp18906_c1_seq1/g.21049 comp18906_c1_seq1/m.21049 type:complete len:152 (-) comp18906_c1_seq1:41-496(-)
MWSLGRVSLEAPCPPDMSDKEYRQLQNVAVENHNGCPPWEVVAILLAAAGGLIVYKAAVSRWPLPAGPLSLILEFVAVVGPCALLLLPQYLLPVVVVEVWLTLLMVLLSRWDQKGAQHQGHRPDAQGCKKTVLQRCALHVYGYGCGRHFGG